MIAEGIEVRELAPDAEGDYLRHYAAKSDQQLRELRLAYERGQGDRFATLMVGMILGALSGIGLATIAMKLL